MQNVKPLRILDHTILCDSSGNVTKPSELVTMESMKPPRSPVVDPVRYLIARRYCSDTRLPNLDGRFPQGVDG
jgi:hypothetical protein